MKIHRKLVTSILKTFHYFNRSSADNCLVPRPHFSSRPKRFGTLGLCENVRPRQKSSKVRQLNGDGKQDQCFEFES